MGLSLRAAWETKCRPKAILLSHAGEGRRGGSGEGSGHPGLTPRPLPGPAPRGERACWAPEGGAAPLSPWETGTHTTSICLLL